MQNISPFFVCGVACFLSQTAKTKAGTAEFGQLVLKSCSEKISCRIVPVGLSSPVQKVNHDCPSWKGHLLQGAL